MEPCAVTFAQIICEGGEHVLQMRLTISCPQVTSNSYYSRFEQQGKVVTKGTEGQLKRTLKRQWFGYLAGRGELSPQGDLLLNKGETQAPPISVGITVREPTTTTFGMS